MVVVVDVIVDADPSSTPQKPATDIYNYEGNVAWTVKAPDVRQGCCLDNLKTDSTFTPRDCHSLESQSKE